MSIAEHICREVKLNYGSIELSAVLEMSINERLRLVEAIWDSIAEHPDALPLSGAEWEELDWRWAD